MLVIIGHGPSINCTLGHLIDRNEVIRLKHGLTRDMPREHFGTRTDYICGRSNLFRPEKAGPTFWHFKDESPWVKYYAQFKPKMWKPSHGLCAVFCAIDYLQPKEIALIGCDRMLYADDDRSKKWNSPPTKAHPWPHDQRAERECLFSLGITIVDFARAHGEVCGV